MENTDQILIKKNHAIAFNVNMNIFLCNRHGILHLDKLAKTKLGIC